MKRFALIFVGVALLVCLLVLGTAGAALAPLQVDSTTDVSDGDTASVAKLIADPGSDGVISLREAIEATNNSGGSDEIWFAIPKSDAGYMVNGIEGTWTISLTVNLPPLSDGGTVISGTSQAVWAGTDPNGYGPEIEVTGVHLSAGLDCLQIESAGNVIHHVVINRCPAAGIVMAGTGATGNIVSGNYIGLDPTGVADWGNGTDGVTIGGGAQSNTVGGDSGAERNLISGNDGHGVWIDGSGTKYNTVSGNFVGTDSTGASALGNADYGVRITAGASANTIGGGSAGLRNIISSNGASGVQISDSGGNEVRGNYIGTDVTGTADRGNALYGVHILSGAAKNIVGGVGAGEGNLISGNDGRGVFIAGPGTDGNTVLGNRIGTDATGDSALANINSGVLISGGAQQNTIGGSTAEARNLISGNGNGIELYGDGTSDNVVSGNYIGTAANGTKALANSYNGVSIYLGCTENIIGGDTEEERNVISGNSHNGVQLYGATTAHNTVAGNYIGTDHSGALDRGNGWSGIAIFDAAHENTIGVSATGTGNLISGNLNGIAISGSGTDDNVVKGNLVGVTAVGDVALPNHGDGVEISSGAQGNTVGGTTSTERNVISGNSGNGIEISGSATSGNQILGNYVGLNAAGTGAVGNAFSGVYVYAPWNTIGGDSDSSRNVISGNGWFGVEIETPDASQNVVSANYIGTTSDGMGALGNVKGGVGTHGGASHNTIGGGTDGRRNVISGNNGPGIWISGGTWNDMLGNYIGISASGDQALANAGDGVVIEGGAQQSSVGSLIPGEGNVISGNDGDGVEISGTDTFLNGVFGNIIGLEDLPGNGMLGNLGSGVVVTATARDIVIQGNTISGNEANGVVLAGGTQSNEVSTNMIGLDASGSLGRRNLLDGVLLGDGAYLNLIGGDAVEEINLISANGQNGVHLTGESTTWNTVSGNWIGIDLSGGDAGNSGAGVKISGGPSNNVVGGPTAAERNILSGNIYGVWITGPASHANKVAGNYIGLAGDGDTVVGNNSDGVLLNGDAHDNVIGGTVAGERNVISGNGDGITIWGGETTGNSVYGNYIGTDATGSLDRGNDWSGVHIVGGHDNTIGGSSEGAGNVISGNNEHGLTLAGSGVHHNEVVGNYVGTNVTGTASVENGLYGLHVSGGAHDNIIGGSTQAEGNLISGNYYSGVVIEGSGTVSNTVSANYLGTDPTGTSPVPNRLHGVVIFSGARYNVIGGDAAGEGNLISGNGVMGVLIKDSGTMSNTLSGNLIGTDVSGGLPLGNTGHGVGIYEGAQYSVVGGDAEGERNVIAGNGWTGVAIVGPGTGDNHVLGNYVGTDASGSADLGNTNHGVHLVSGAQNNSIGGDAPDEGNVISGNDDSGVRVEGSGTDGNIISGNYVGTNVTGTLALANGEDGVLITAGAQLNVVGGDAVGARNLISGNDNHGVTLEGSGTMSNTVSGNYIGISVGGDDTLGNAKYGVALADGTQGNTLGGISAAERNIISGNWMGVRLAGSGTSGNSISGNYIGTDASGALDLGNAWHGVHIVQGAQGNTLGGDIIGGRNVISGNDHHGVRVENSGTDGNTISGNYIGTNAAGTGDLGNGWAGVSIAGGPQGTLVGGDTEGEKNLISGNDSSGVLIGGSSAMSNTVSGNWIGLDSSGLAPLANAVDGVQIGSGAQRNTVGGNDTGHRNVISGNGGHGVSVSGSGTMSNTITGNYIGTNAVGSVAVANAGDGIYLSTGTQGNQIGPANHIAFNSLNGVRVDGASTVRNRITENSIHSSSLLGIDNTDLGNTNLAPPEITVATTAALTGTAPADSTVEVFTGPDDEGRTYLATTSAGGSGDWSVAGPFVSEGFFTATATDASGNTSEFSEAVEVEVTTLFIYLPLVTRDD